MASGIFGAGFIRSFESGGRRRLSSQKLPLPRYIASAETRRGTNRETILSAVATPRPRTYLAPYVPEKVLKLLFFSRVLLPRESTCPPEVPLTTTPLALPTIVQLLTRTTTAELSAATAVNLSNSVYNLTYLLSASRTKRFRAGESVRIK